MAAEEELSEFDGSFLGFCGKWNYRRKVELSREVEVYFHWDKEKLL